MVAVQKVLWKYLAKGFCLIKIRWDIRSVKCVNLFEACFTTKKFHLH